MLNAGVRAVGEERRKSSQGNLDRLGTPSCRKRRLTLKEWDGLAGVEERKEFWVHRGCLCAGRLMCILSHSYSGSVRGGCYFHFTVEETEEHRIYVSDPSSPS